MPAWLAIVIPLGLFELSVVLLVLVVHRAMKAEDEAGQAAAPAAHAEEPALSHARAA